MQNGSCLCGAVTFRISGEMRDVLACHCQQCRKTSGHYWAATSVRDTALEMTRKGGLAWFRASDTAQRGFCNLCGSTLFWKPDNADRTAVSADALDGATGLELSQHVFVADKGDYYALSDGKPQHTQFSGGEDA